MVDDLSPGLHSLCTIAFGGDYRNPEYMKRLTKTVQATMPVHCQDINLRVDETLTVEVVIPGWEVPPPMAPSDKSRIPESE